MLKGFQKHKVEAKEKLEFYARQNKVAKLKFQQMKLMSHQLLTPLHGIRGSISILSNDNLTSAQIESLNDILEKTNEVFNFLKSVCGFEINSTHKNEQKIEFEKKHFPSAKVLLVEDDPLNQKISKSYLEKMSISPDIAENGRVALEMVENNHYDAVLMDLTMPEMDGLSTTRKIRKESNIPKSLIIIGLTANSSLEFKRDCMVAGMNDYLSKPATFDDVLSCFNKWLPRVTSQQERPPSTSKSLVSILKKIESSLESQNFDLLLENAQQLEMICDELQLTEFKAKASSFKDVCQTHDIQTGKNIFFDLKDSLKFICKLSADTQKVA